MTGDTMPEPTTPDTDLDAVEARHRKAEDLRGLDKGQSWRLVGALLASARDVPVLLARVRTAEAERDEARAHWEAQSRIVVADLIEGARALHAERTVETAEEWEEGVRYENGAERFDLDDPRQYVDRYRALGDADMIVVRRRPAGPSEPVPPTPEEPADV